MAKELYGIGELPPLGEIPAKMHAWTIREERFAEPVKSFQQEILDVPTIADNEVLLYMMAAGVNYNNVWAALGLPVNVIAARKKAGELEDFHIGGSDASGIVYKVGKNVKNVKPGDEVVVHCGTYDPACPTIADGQDPMFSPTFRIWGYETNYGSFAQFTKVQDHQCLPKPKHLTWEESSAYMLVGATAYRQLMGWGTHSIKPGDVVLIWGGAGGLGSMAIQVTKALGGIPVAVVSSEDKFDYCKALGAAGCINRKDFDHWGMLPHWKDKVGYANWLKGVRSFGKAIWDVVGEKKSPRIVFEHPGEYTIPTSLFVCDTGGMVVICAGTSGFNATLDLRYMWMRQKRLQGSHFANDQQAEALNRLVMERKVDPGLSKTFTWDQLPDPHQLMYENRHPSGNMAILVGAKERGLGIDARIPTEIITPVQKPQVIREEIYVPPQAEVEEPVLFEDDTRVREILHQGLITCAPSASLDEVAMLLVEHNIHAVAVVVGGEAVGVVSQTDIVLARQGRSPEELKTVTVSEIMSGGLITCRLDTPISQAVTTMTRNRIHRLIVVDDSNNKRIPIGVISMTDIIRKMIGARKSDEPYKDAN